MQITDNLDQRQWNKFVADHTRPSAFLQSWAWGEFQKSLGHKIYRVAIEDGGVILGTAQAVVKKLYLGKTYLEVPKGPVIASGDMKQKTFEMLAEHLTSLAREENAILIRF